MIQTIVSFTPLPVDRDSRTLKIASSIQRLGYRSIVMENRRSVSVAAANLEIGVITLGGLEVAEESNRSKQVGAGTRDDFLTRIKTVLRPLAPEFIRSRLHFLGFIIVYFIIRPVQGLFQTPRASLYYLHEYRLYPLVSLLRLFRPAPLVYDAHDFYPEVYDSASLSKFWRNNFIPFLGWMEQWCANNADIVVNVGEGVADLFERRYGIKPIVIANAHDPRLECEPEMGLRQQLGLAATDLLVVVVGNHKPGQAVEPLLAALTGFPENVHVAFVGRHHEPTAALAVRYGLVGRVHTAGAVKPEEIVPYIRSADIAAILYYPVTGNYLNILPNGFFQSLSAGLPLLYPDLPEIKKIVSNRQVGREIDPQDKNSIARELSWMLKNEDKFHSFRKNLAVLAQAQDWQHEEIKLRNLVDDLVTVDTSMTNGREKV